jgi:hypothetical protein
MAKSSFSEPMIDVLRLGDHVVVEDDRGWRRRSIIAMLPRAFPRAQADR